MKAMICNHIIVTCRCGMLNRVDRKFRQSRSYLFTNPWIRSSLLVRRTCVVTFQTQIRLVYERMYIIGSNGRVLHPRFCRSCVWLYGVTQHPCRIGIPLHFSLSRCYAVLVGHACGYGLLPRSNFVIAAARGGTRLRSCGRSLHGCSEPSLLGSGRPPITWGGPGQLVIHRPGLAELERGCDFMVLLLQSAGAGCGTSRP